MSELCIRKEDEPNLFVFYDDAQNLYGRKRPNWHSLGLNLVGGRSHVMTECFRNTRQIVEASFNVLYGSFAADKGTVPTKAFGDISTLEQKGLLEQVDGRWTVKFAKRSGAPPMVSVQNSAGTENEAVVGRLRWLIAEQDVRPRWPVNFSVSDPKAAEYAAVVAKELKSVSSGLPANPVCSLWVERWTPSGTCGKYLFVLQSHGGIMYVTDDVGFNLAMRWLRRQPADEHGRPQLPLGVSTNFNINELPQAGEKTAEEDAGAGAGKEKSP